MAARGGKRPGAGRPQGRKDKATIEQLATLEELAREHTPLALDTLARVCASSESDAARVSAAQALLDRAYGKPKQAIEHTGKDGEPVQVQHSAADEILRRLDAIAARKG